jgi:hypothetical protein
VYSIKNTHHRLYSLQLQLRVGKLSLASARVSNLQQKTPSAARRIGAATPGSGDLLFCRQLYVRQLLSNTQLDGGRPFRLSFHRKQALHVVLLLKIKRTHCNV